MAKPCILLVLALVATSLIAADATDPLLKCYEYTETTKATGGTPKPTVACSATVTTNCIMTCAAGVTKCYRANSADSAGGCVTATPKLDCTVFTAAYKAVDAAGWCAECATPLCNSAPGLSVGGLSMIILGTVMQVLA